MRKLKALVLYVVIISIIIGVNVNADKKTKATNIYATWRGLETDKCASAWLIRRFIDKNAQFKFFAKGTLIKEGIPFDTPNSELRRDARLPTFGNVMRKYGVKDPILEDMNKIVWDIEVNSWDRKVTTEAAGLDAIIHGLTLIAKNDEECLEKSLVIFDALYAHIKLRRNINQDGKNK
jgi:hypothetical protein